MPPILCSPKRHVRVHNGPPNVPALSQINPVHVIHSYFFTAQFKNVLTSMSRFSKWLLSSHHPTTFCMYFFPLLAACPTHLITLDLITIIISSEDYKLWSSPLCSLLKSLVKLHVFRSKYRPQHPILEQSQICHFLRVRDSWQNYSSAYFNLYRYCQAVYIPKLEVVSHLCYTSTFIV